MGGRRRTMDARSEQASNASHPIVTITTYIKLMERVKVLKYYPKWRLRNASLSFVFSEMGANA